MVIKLMGCAHKSVSVNKTEYGKVNIASSFFDLLILDILKFFDTGVIPFDKEQTLKAMALREKVIELL